MNKKIKNKIATYLLIALTISIILTFIANLINYYLNRDGHELMVFALSSLLCLAQFTISFTAFLNLLNKIRENLILRFLTFNFSSILFLIVIFYQIIIQGSNILEFLILKAMILPYIFCLIILSLQFNLFIIKLKKAS